MIRSTQSFLKQATRLSQPAISSVPHRAPLQVTVRASSMASSSFPSDYDQIMHTTATVSSFSSSALSSASTFPSAYLPITIMSADIKGAATAQVPSGMGVAQNVTTTNCYRSLGEPTECEDYDRHELHHPPCERTQESYYEASYDPNAAGSVVSSSV
eukprot:100481_1